MAETDLHSLAGVRLQDLETTLVTEVKVLLVVWHGYVTILSGKISKKKIMHTRYVAF